MSNRIQIAAAAFLIAVLWMDLKFDFLLLPHIRAGEPATRETLDAIAVYYKRVIAAEREGGMLIASVMVTGIAACGWQVLRAKTLPMWTRAALALLYIPPVVLAMIRIVPLAQRFSGQTDTIETQRAMVAEILCTHMYCFVSMTLCLGLLLLTASRGGGQQTRRFALSPSKPGPCGQQKVQSPDRD